MVPVTDLLGRGLASLRLSVTDRCNLRCAYCMPEEEYRWLPRTHLLSFEELVRLVRVLEHLGLAKVRLTGGEPLLRRALPTLVAMLRQGTAIHDLAMTTNGIGLDGAAFRSAGLCRVTVSLDTLQPDRFAALCRRPDLGRVLAGIDSAGDAGLPMRLNTVVMRAVNDDEILDILAFAWARGIEPRLIEYMDVGGATQWSPDAVVGCQEILATVAEALGPVTAMPGRGTSPAQSYSVGGRTFGIIASTTRPFCDACNRARVTADGRFYHCLYARDGLDLRALLAQGDAALLATIEASWRARQDRGAVERLQNAARGPLVESHELRREPHLEMHTRGG
jgi:cyclic pyranopterin phosphate synthase